MTDPLTFIITTVIAAIVGIISKILWDYIKGGQVEKTSIYVPTSVCQGIRDNCGLTQLIEKYSFMYSEIKEYKADMNIRLIEIVKHIEKSDIEIRTFQQNIIEIKEAQIRSNVLLETIAEKLKN